MAEADPAATASEVSSMEESAAAAAAAMEEEVAPASASPAPADDPAPLKETEDEPQTEEAAPPPSMGSSETDEIPAAAPDHKRKLEDLEQPLEYEEAPEKKHEVIVPVDAAAADQASDEAGSVVVPTAVQKATEIVTPISTADPSVAVYVKRQRIDGETDGSAFDEENEVQNLEAPLVGNGQYPSIENTEHAQVDNFQPSISSFSQQGIIPSAEQQLHLQAITSSTKLEVPNNKVGVLIGKAGETIRVLQQNSGAKIQITRDAEADPNSSTRPVEIIGTLESINKAEQLIKDVIAEAEAGGSPALVARGIGNAQSGTEQHEILVPNEKVGMIIGKRGETIKNLQTRSGARIQLIPQHLPEGDASKERNVRVTGDKKQIEAAKEMIKEVMNQVPRPSHRSYSQQTLRPGGPSPIPQWATRPPAPAQQPTGYDYQQRGTYPPQSTQYPQPYSSYPKQQPPRSSVSTGWDQRATTPVQTGGYDYYGQGGQAIETQSSNPAPGLSPAPVNYNYGQSQATTGYGQPSPYTQPTPVQQSYAHGYDEQQNYGQQQQYYGQQQQGVAAYAQQGGTPQQPGYAQQQTYGKPAAYGGAPQSYAPPRATSQPGDPMYQGGPAASYGPGGSTQQSYPYGQSAPSQQPAPGYGQAYGPTSGAVDGYTQPSAVSSYPQPSQVPPGYGSQPAPAYAQQVAQSGGYGQQQYPPSQPGYGDQTVPNNVSYGGYQGAPVDAGYGGGSVQNSGGYSSAPVGNQAGYGQVAAGYAQPQSYPSGYEHSMQQPQSGYGVGQQLQSGYGVGQQPGNATAPVGGYTKGLSPQPGYGGQYDSAQMYGQQH